ncbi:polysaccharide lyase family 14 protein [Neolentinus lepideus HHB14362 ss-1]|uniref:Polysaccharide lyase family 14 protein n=1 Tax=Neolentinus lepideus HHB14362 ss-1 TaxID=1314782 RepID=A0A165MVK0_9AGAM|nr:polysaccharide lyase family 14 protein [Neolentinus lepideus HHB14362 ss-1]
MSFLTAPRLLSLLLALAATSDVAAVPTLSSRATSCSLSELFPDGQGSNRWTTCPSSSSSVSLSDSTLRPTNNIAALSHKYVTPPDGSSDTAMQAHYPKGSYVPSESPQGGFSFYASGPKSVDLTTAKETTFGYRVWFPSGFDFVKGGKLPGLYGGNSASGSISCSGGARDDACFSARFMWRTDGAGELYTYLPPSYSANNNVCNVAPYSTCNPTYGASVGRGAFTFATGAWTTISQRVRLNDAGAENGELEVFANGKSVISVGGLVLRNSSSGRIRGMMMQTFFGGSTSDWATPRDQDVYFADLSVAITKTL